MSESSEPSIFLETCILSAAQTKAVTEIHNTIMSLIRFFLFIAAMSPHYIKTYHFYSSCSLSVSRFSELFKARAAQIKAAKARNSINKSFVNIFFIIHRSPYDSSAWSVFVISMVPVIDYIMIISFVPTL